MHQVLVCFLQHRSSIWDLKIIQSISHTTGICSKSRMLHPTFWWFGESRMQHPISWLSYRRNIKSRMRHSTLRRWVTFIGRSYTGYSSYGPVSEISRLFSRYHIRRVFAPKVGCCILLFGGVSKVGCSILLLGCPIVETSKVGCHILLFDDLFIEHLESRMQHPTFHVMWYSRAPEIVRWATNVCLKIELCCGFCANSKKGSK